VLTENFFDFDAKTFTKLRVAEPSQNSFHHPMSYVLEPSLEGISRHDDTAPVWPNVTEGFAQHDFFVTKFSSNELLASIGDPTTGAYQDPDAYLIASLTNESVANANVVLWYRSSTHHLPQDEDRPNWTGHTSPDRGITLVHWMGFELAPHDFFDFNPLGGPHYCGSCGNGVCNSNEDCCTCPEDCAPPGSLSCC
jgi:Cu2+-containing amine oxidase